MTNTMIGNANKVVEMINARGIKAEIQTKSVNGVESIGITMGDGTVRPTIYPNLDNGMDLDKTVDDLIKTYEQHKDTTGLFTDVVENFGNFDAVKGNIIPCLVAKVADDLVSRDYLDLKVMYRYITADKQASVAIKKNHIDMWGVTEEELFDIAKENARPTFINMSMMQMLSEMSGIPAEDMLPGVIDDPMRVFTTQSRSWGASVLLFPEMFAYMGNDITILPSSVHEVIALANNNGIDNSSFISMITEINQTQVKPEEVLSNHPYVYTDGEIKEVA